MAETGITARDFTDEDVIRHLRCSSDGFLVTISNVTEETHDGRFFYTSYYNASLGSGANIDIHLVTGSTSPHIGMMVDIGSAGLVNMYEDITTSNNGTAISIYNANRNSENVSNALAYHTPTVTGTGTNFFGPHYIAASSSGNSNGGVSVDYARITEFILKPNTKYLFRATNLGVSAVPASIQLGWFENV